MGADEFVSIHYYPEMIDLGIHNHKESIAAQARVTFENPIANVQYLAGEYGTLLLVQMDKNKYRVCYGVSFTDYNSIHSALKEYISCLEHYLNTESKLDK